MRKTYTKILKNHFYNHLIATRTALNWTQAEMANQLIMDDRSYINLDHGKSGCSALTLALYLIYCSDDPVKFLDELKAALENDENHVA